MFLVKAGDGSRAINIANLGEVVKKEELGEAGVVWFSIWFHFNNMKDFIIWYYDGEDGKKMRDEDFEKIINWGKK